jgi:hypothetical protein
MESQITTEYKNLHQIMYRKYFLLTTGTIVLLLIVVFCYDAYSAYLLTYGKNTYLRGSR